MNIDKTKVLAIINPISGIRPKNNIPKLLEENLDHSKFEFSYKFTEFAGHATIIARDAVENGINYILAVGGDGTINETAKALVHTNVSLGIIPLGSGNGLARHLQIPLETVKAIKTINEQNNVKIDYCKANGHIFFCTAGVGFDAWISKKFAEDKHRGGLTYFKNVLGEYLKYKSRMYTISTADGEICEKAFLVACANASQYGNNAYIAPEASMQDGLMDITIIKPFNHIEATQIAVQLFTKQLPRNSKSTTIRSNNVKILLEKPEVMHVDGDPILVEKEIDIQVHPGGLNILVPKHPTHSIIEPIQHVIEEIHYNIVSDIKDVLKIKK